MIEISSGVPCWSALMTPVLKPSRNVMPRHIKLLACTLRSMLIPRYV